MDVVRSAKTLAPSAPTRFLDDARMRGRPRTWPCAGWKKSAALSHAAVSSPARPPVALLQGARRSPRRPQSARARAETGPRGRVVGALRLARRPPATPLAARESPPWRSARARPRVRLNRRELGFQIVHLSRRRRHREFDRRAHRGPGRREADARARGPRLLRGGAIVTLAHARGGGTGAPFAREAAQDRPLRGARNFPGRRRLFLRASASASSRLDGASAPRPRRIARQAIAPSPLLRRPAPPRSTPATRRASFGATVSGAPLVALRRRPPSARLRPLRQLMVETPDERRVRHRPPAPAVADPPSRSASPFSASPPCRRRSRRRAARRFSPPPPPRAPPQTVAPAIELIPASSSSSSLGGGRWPACPRRPPASAGSLRARSRSNSPSPASLRRPNSAPPRTPPVVSPPSSASDHSSSSARERLLRRLPPRRGRRRLRAFSLPLPENVVVRGEWRRVGRPPPAPQATMAKKRRRAAAVGKEGGLTLLDGRRVCGACSEPGELRGPQQRPSPTRGRRRATKVKAPPTRGRGTLRALLFSAFSTSATAAGRAARGGSTHARGRGHRGRAPVVGDSRSRRRRQWTCCSTQPRRRLRRATTRVARMAGDPGEPQSRLRSRDAPRPPSRHRCRPPPRALLRAARPGNVAPNQARSRRRRQSSSSLTGVRAGGRRRDATRCPWVGRVRGHVDDAPNMNARRARTAAERDRRSSAAAGEHAAAAPPSTPCRVVGAAFDSRPPLSC